MDRYMNKTLLRLAWLCIVMGWVGWIAIAVGAFK